MMTEDQIVAIAHAQARAFQRTDEDRHLETIGKLLNDAEDPLNAAKKLARRCGRELASEFLDPKIVNAGARGWFRP